MTKLTKNILFVNDIPFANAGGVGRVTETLSEEFVRRGFNVTYLAFCKGQECEISGIKQLFVPDVLNITSKTNIRYLENMIETSGIDVIINQGGFSPKVIQVLSKAVIGNTQLLSVHHNCVSCLQDNYQDIITYSYRHSKLFKLMDHPLGWTLAKWYNRKKYGYYFQRTIMVSDKLVLLSERFVQELRTYVQNFSTKKVVGIPNPMPFEVVDGSENMKENRLVFVGRLNYQQKRADLLIDIWKRIFVEYPDWSFDIVGDGPVKKELEQKAKDEGLERIYFHGYQDPRHFLKKAKFFCMTSAFEGYGMVLVEAQAYGVVPFAFDCFSALPDIIQTGENGFVFLKFDITLYAKTLRQLMSDEELRKQMAKNGQKSVLKFHPRIICDKWVHLFEELE